MLMYNLANAFSRKIPNKKVCEPECQKWMVYYVRILAKLHTMKDEHVENVN